MDFLNNIQQQVKHARDGTNQGQHQQQQDYNSSSSSHQQQPQKTSVSDGLLSLVDGGARDRRRHEEEERAHQALIEQKRKERDSQGVLGDIKDFFDGGADAEAKRLAEERERKRKAEEEAGVFGKVSGIVGIGGQQQQTSSSTGLFNKMLGKEEQKPDYVDHSVDLVQEHIFKQGSQKNEGFTENLKDQYLANTIRGALGIKK
ncbi:hypothetical protein DFH27DRAFT_562033 [Peziza echinospora]|nr:hypothetical protein DFH27DRAFT_562033 [Peziza echinospora]